MRTESDHLHALMSTISGLDGGQSIVVALEHVESPDSPGTCSTSCRSSSSRQPACSRKGECSPNPIVCRDKARNMDMMCCNMNET